MKQHETDLLGKRRSYLAASLWNSTLTRWNMHRGIWCDSPQQRWDFEATQSRRKSTTGVVAQFGNHTVKSGSTLQSLTALSVGEAEFYSAVKGGQVGWSLRSMFQDLGSPMKIEIQSDSSTANSFTDRLGAGQRTKHVNTRHFWMQERVQDGTSPSINKVSTATICTDVGTKLGSASKQQQHCKFEGLVFYSPWIPHSTTRWMLTKPMMDLVMGCDPVMDEQDTRYEHGDPVRSTSGQRWSWPSRRMCHERIMAAVAMTRCSAKFCEHWLVSKLAITFRAHRYAMMTERADAFSGPGRICTRVWLASWHSELFVKNPLAHVLLELF